MKLNKTADFIDLKSESDGGNWMVQAIEGITAKVPIMTSIAKGTEAAHFSFMGLARHANLAETLVSKSNRFHNPSEVYRAAQYIGMSLLYYLTKDEGTMEQKARSEQVYKLLQVMEEINHRKQLIDTALLAAKDIMAAHENGAVEFEEMQDKMHMILEALPGGLAKVVQGKIKGLIKGDKVEDLLETRRSKGTRQLTS